MQRLLHSCLVFAGVLMLGLAQALAQSGVLSGPPQTKQAPPAPPMVGVSPEQRLTWIAVAAGFDGRGRNVAVGYSGHHSSRIDAEQAALRACNGYGRGVRCRNPVAASAGCLYLAPGSRRGGVTWGRGSTRESALRECRRGGYTCPSNRIVGGCVPVN
jgi:hypothetical protein